MFALKLKYNKSWEYVLDFLTELLSEFEIPKRRLRDFVEKAIVDLDSHTCEERQELYAINLDLDYVGPACADLGITRRKVLDVTKLTGVSSDVVTNQLIIEIYDLCKKDRIDEEYIVLVLQNLLPSMNLETKEVQKCVRSLKSQQQNLAKNKTRSEKYENFMNELFTFPSEITDVNRKMKNVENYPKERLENRLRAQSHLMDNLKGDIATLQGIIETKNNQISDLEKKISLNENKIKKQTDQLIKQEEQLKSISKQNENIKEDLKKTRSGALYQKLRRKCYKQSSELNKLKTGNHGSEVKRLKKLVKCVRRSLYNQTQKTKFFIEMKKNMKTEIDQLKERIKNAESELSLLKSDHIITKSDEQGSPYLNDIEKCVMHLIGECDVSSTKCAQVISAVSHWVFNKNVDVKDLPSSSTCVNIMDRAQVLSKIQVGHSILNSKSWNYHSDGTTRDHNKVMGMQVDADGHMLSAGYSGVAVEDGDTLLDNAISMMNELAYVLDDGQMSPLDVVNLQKTLLSKMFATMSDRASVNKSFNSKLNDYRQQQGNETDLHMLYCNAHFLLGLSNICESTLKTIESNLSTEIGEKLGRNKNDKFRNFHSSESSAARYVRLASDSLGPRGDEKSGCRLQWESYCTEKLSKKSKITSFRMNRFNNFFEGAASLFYHRNDVIDFLSNYKDSVNLKLESVLLDAKCDYVQALIRSLGIVFYKVTGPFWALLNSNVEYLDLYVYVQKMFRHFQEWSVDSSPLLNSESLSVFDLPFDVVKEKEKTKFHLKCEKNRARFLPENLKRDPVYMSLFSENEHTEVTKEALQNIFKGFITCTQRQLSEFLPGGRYGEEPSLSLRAKMEFAKVTNLVSENEFGDLDFSQFRRRHASLHYHSGIQMVKRNKTISSWLSKKSETEQDRLLIIARNKSSDLRKRHAAAQKEIRVKIQNRLDENHRIQVEKEAKASQQKKKIIEDVHLHGGPFLDCTSIDKFMKSKMCKSAKLNVLKEEVRYMRKILEIKDNRLVIGKKTLSVLVSDIKSVLCDTPDSHLPNCSIDVLNSDHPAYKKRRCDNEISPPNDTQNHAEAFLFTSTGTWVAVAYEGDYFIGEVIEIYDESSAMIQFLTRGFKDVFRYPQIDDVDTIDSKYVFAHDFEVNLSPNGRTWSVPELNYIDDLYKQYAEYYFE